MTGFDRSLVIAGAALFVLGLLQGGAVDWFHNPRMALSAHLTAVQSGTAMMVAGALFGAVALSPAWRAVARWAIVGSMIGLWFGLTLSAATGASEALPMAGEGYRASASMETLVSAIVLAASGAMVVGWGLFLAGLLRRPR